MRKKIINPFLNRNKITDQNDFFGRTREVDYLIDMLTYPEPQSVSIIGERRYGKSSLLTYIYSLLSDKTDERLQNGDKFVCIFLDPEEIAADNASDITWIIIDELISENQNLLKYVEPYPVRENKKEIPLRRPRIILKNLLKDACNNGYKFIFLIDEFELLAQRKQLLETDYLQYLRGISDNYKLAFVTSSRKQLKEICIENNMGASPFDNNFIDSIYVGLLGRSECRELIKGTLKKYGFSSDTFEPHEIEEVINLAGKQPYFLKMACAHLFEWVINNRQNPSNWQKKFQKEASEEFHRMWNALNEEERDWILVAQQSGAINCHEAFIHKSLASLHNKGLFKSVENDTKLELFSSAFSNFIKEHVKALESDYEEIERQICEGYIKFDIENIKSTLEHLNRLKEEWKKREKKTNLPPETYIKCDHLSLIFQSLYNLIILLKETMGTSHRKTALTEKIDNNLNSLAGYFEETEWFGEKGGTTIELQSGKRMLDQLVDLLKENEKQQIFGNGFDRILSARINFMKNHGWEKFQEFRKQVEDAFDRLIKVYDYSRASQILQIKQCRFTKYLSDLFFSHPLFTVLLIIVGTFWFNNLVIEFLKIKANIPNTMYLNLSWIWVAALHFYLICTMYKGAISEKSCKLSESKKLFKKAVFPGTLVYIILGVLFCISIANSIEGLIQDITKPPYFPLLIASAIGIGSLFMVSMSIKQKVPSFKIAFRRAEYFCSIEYLKTFWLVMIISILLYFFSMYSECIKNINVLGKIAQNSYSYLGFPILINFLGVPINYLAVLTLSFIAPLVGAFKFTIHKK